MKLTFLGDIHSQMVNAEKKTRPRRGDLGTIIQIGDLGMGFSRRLRATRNRVPFRGDAELLESRIDFFIRGNHDNPEECRKNPSYLGDYGYNDFLNMFWVGGAHSIDSYKRTEGLDWWPDEQLSYAEMGEAVALYKESKPRIMLTHDCPISIAKAMFGFSEAKLRYNNTNLGLEAMFEAHQPEHWIFGHYHQNRFKKVNNTLFRCVKTLDTYTIEV